MADSPELLPPGDEPMTRLFAGKSPMVRIQTTGQQLGPNVTGGESVVQLLDQPRSQGLTGYGCHQGEPPRPHRLSCMSACALH
jgi:hypothetical protein